MITIIIPTRNRAYTLGIVAHSYYCQPYVNEVIFVDDCGEDDTADVVQALIEQYPEIKSKYIRHTKRHGAAAGRITGYEAATNEYVLFGEDDAILESNYTSVLIKKITANSRCGIVSGRIIYLRPKEALEAAARRFGNGTESKPYFNKINFTFNRDAKISGDFPVPFTHALFLTKKKLLQNLTYDPFYSNGNGFREETDFQINALVNDKEILVTNDTHCFHLHVEDVPSGGQRIGRFRQFYWNVFYTNYIFDKYFEDVKKKLGIKYSKRAAKNLFAAKQFYILFIRPLQKLPEFLLRKIY